MTNDLLPENPVVSVLCTTYNHRDYIGEAIEGVLAQRTDFPIELIVRDDASTDGTREVVDAYARRHPGLIRAVFEPENRYRQGIRPLQAALAHARGEFIAVCEGDDFWTEPSKLQRQVDFLRAHPEVGLVHTDFDDLTQRRGQWRRIPGHHHRARKEIPEGRVFEQLLAGNFIQTCTVCLRTVLVRAYFASGLQVANYPVGDWPLFLFVAAAHDIAFLQESTAAYRQTPGSMMNSGTASRVRTLMAYVPMIEEFSSYGGASESNRNYALVQLYRSMYSLSLLAENREAMSSARKWLYHNDRSYLVPFRRRLIPLLFRIPFSAFFSRLAHRTRCWLVDQGASS